jgi:hypothetical protein
VIRLLAGIPNEDSSISRQEKRFTSSPKCMDQLWDSLSLTVNSLTL